MTSAARFLLAIAAISVVGGAVGLVAGHFHVPQSYTSAGVGVVIGVGVALGAFSRAPKRTKCN